ncbi:MAG: hypothetical protein V1926_03580 [Candidatus Peregrinibacteria bacterium]
MLRRRHYGSYPLATPSVTGAIVRSLILLVLLAAILVVIGMKVLSWFGVGNALRQNAVLLTVDGPGSVGVSIAGQEPKKTESSMKVYPGDRLETSEGTRATLEFLDGTLLRLDTATVAEIMESERGEEQSQWSIDLTKGSLWVRTPTIQAFSGSIKRDIETSAMLLTIPSQTEAVITPFALTVFSADGLGISALLTGRDMPMFIGEGQELVLPTGLVEGDPYRFRSPLDPLLMRPFVEESRKLLLSRPTPKSGSGEMLPPSLSAENGEVLTVNEPKEGEVVSASIVRVSGTIAGTVDRLRINGYLVPFDPVTRAFSREISLPDEDEVILLIEALAADGTVQAKVQRNVSRNRTPPAAPAIVSPAKNGETYATDRDTIEINGTAPAGTVGIIVNDYRLQLFKPGDETWSYLANAKLGNMLPGLNTFSAVAINAGGYKSPAATMQIIYGEGKGEGVIAAAGTGSSLSTPPPEEEVMPENAPLAPGSLSVTGPTPGKSHTATGSAMLIEGTTSPETTSMWVNGYRLQLYKAGKTTWNYIADASLQTLRRGTNVYHILSRNSSGQILDKIDYSIIWRPGR